MQTINIQWKYRALPKPNYSLHQHWTQLGIQNHGQRTFSSCSFKHTPSFPLPPFPCLCLSHVTSQSEFIFWLFSFWLWCQFIGLWSRGKSLDGFHLLREACRLPLTNWHLANIRSEEASNIHLDAKNMTVNIEPIVKNSKKYIHIFVYTYYVGHSPVSGIYL